MLWKIYFWVYYLSVLGGSLSLSNPTPVKLVMLLLQIISLVGIYTFIWGSRGRQQVLWRIILFVYLLIQVLFILYRFTSFSLFIRFFPDIKMENSLFAITSTLFVFPLFSILYALGYKNLKKHEEQRVPVSKLALCSMFLGFFSVIPIPFLGIGALLTGILALFRINKKDIQGKIFAWMGITSFLFFTVLLAAGVTVTAFLMQGPAMYYRGSRAVENMNQQELQFLSTRLDKITKETTPQEVEQILGKPVNTKVFYITTSYYFSCSYLNYSVPSRNCSIKIDFMHDQAIAITWIDIKKFFYSRKITQ